MSEIKLLKLGEDFKCSFLSGFAFKSKDYVNEGIPIIKIGNIQGKRVSANLSVNYFSKDLVDDKIADYYLKDRDVLIAMTGQGSVGRVGKLILPSSEKALLNQRVGKFICDEINLNIDYLFYVLTTDLYQDYLFSAGTGSGQPNLSPEVILETEIPALPYNEQCAIASVLSSLDDKIDLLHRQNTTLEAMAETLFRQWFVEEAQEGWEEKPLSSIAEHKKYNVKPDQNPATIYRHYSIPAFDDGKQPVMELGSEIKSNKYQVVPNSILISKLNPRFPRVWAITDLMDENSICSTEFQVVYPTQAIYYGFIYCLLKSKQVTEELIGAAGGTSGSHQRVKPEDIFNLSFQMPPNERIGEFNLIASDHLKKVSTNTKQIRTLEKLRDTLLPKLMSGEVRVKLEQQEAGT